MNAAGVVSERRSRTNGGSLWAWAGAAAGLAGAAAMQVSVGLGATDYQKTGGDPAKATEILHGQADSILVMHTTLMAATVLLPVFAAGLWRRLRPAVPGDSLLPAVASVGLVLTAVATLLGSGLDTELYFGLNSPSGSFPEEFGLVGAHWLATIPWLWAGAGLSGVALAAASLKYRAVPLWLGWTSLLLGGLTLLAGVSPLQYAAGFTGPVWLLVIGLGLALSRPAVPPARG